MTEEVKGHASGSEENRPYQNGTYTRHTVAIKEDNTAEDVLQTFAKIVRGILCVLAVAVFIACIYCGVSERGDLLFLLFIVGLLTAVIIVIVAFLFWARIQVIVNISLTLKKINSKIK